MISNFIHALADVLHLFFTLYIYMIIARAVVSWISVNPYSPFVQFLYRVTEPVLSRARRLLPPMAGLDLSPVVVIFVILFLDRFLVNTLRQLA